MSRYHWERVATAIVLATSALRASCQSASKNLDRQFQAAVAEYNSGNLPRAAADLEKILPSLPNHFEVEELLGLVYTGMSQDARALPHLQAAVRMQPTNEAAQTNLAVSLRHLDRLEEAGEHLRRAQTLAPQDYSANHNLGEFYAQTGKVSEAVALLERAQHAKPDAYDNGYDLATAQMLAGRFDAARLSVESLRRIKDTGELRNLEGQIDEKDNNFVAAANDFEAAAHLDPSESNIFDWGTELLLHRTYEPAIEVFRAGTKRYPSSARLNIGLGMTLYARGLYEDAVKALLIAADLDPADPRCYLFLSRAYDSSPAQADDVIERFRRYATLQPGNARAQFYYAMSLWKGKRVQGETVDLTEIESLLTKSITLDDNVAETHFQLGNAYSSQHQYEKSLPEYQRAVSIDPALADAHYRLATDYTHLGSKDKAQEELAIYQKLRADHLAQVDRERAEIRQFVSHSKDSPQKP